tara:strand:+ start:1879 stop:4473 length:2595 start_codon:yes stop_codon:yes gene_type:complete
MASGFRSSARGGSFRNRSAGDSGLAKERERTQQVVSGLKEQRNAYSKIHGDNIAGLERVNNLEEENRADIKSFENKKFEVRRQAIKERQRTEYNRDMAKAKQYEQQSKFWAGLSKTLGQSLADVAGGIKQGIEVKQASAAQQTRGRAAVAEEKIFQKLLDDGDLDAYFDAMDAFKRGNVEEALYFAETSPKATVGSQTIWAARRLKTIDIDIAEYFKNITENGGIVNALTVEKHGERYRGFVLAANGWTNSKNEAVGKWNEAFTAKLKALKKHYRDEARKTKFKELTGDAQQLLKAQQTPENFTRLVKLFSMSSDDTTGLPVGMGASIDASVQFMAENLEFPEEIAKEILNSPTPEEGRQKPDETYLSRRSDLWEKYKAWRTEAKKKATQVEETNRKYTDSKESQNIKHWFAGTGKFAEGGELDGQGWDGSTESRTERYTWAKTNGLTKTAALIEAYAPYDETVYTKGLQVEYAAQLHEAGDWDEAYEFIENVPGWTNEDRREAKAKFPELRQLALAGSSVKKIDEEIETRLRVALGKEYQGPQRLTPASLQQTVVNGRVYFVNQFKLHSKNKTKDSAGYAASLELAWKDTKGMIEFKDGDQRGQGWAQIELASDSESGQINFPMAEHRLDPDGWTTTQAEELLKSSADPWGTEEILATKAVNRLAIQLNNGEPIRVPEIAREYSIAKKIPIHELINGQLSQTRTSKGGVKITWSQRMKPGARDIVLAGADLPGYLNVAERIKRANSLAELQGYNNFVQSGGLGNLKNSKPEVVNATVGAAPFKPVTAKMFRNREVADKWAEVLSGCGDGCNLGDISHISADETKFKLTPGSITSRTLIQRIGSGQAYGITYNSITGNFIITED